MKSVLLALLIVAAVAVCVAEKGGRKKYCLIGAGPGGMVCQCMLHACMIFRGTSALQLVASTFTAQNSTVFALAESACCCVT